MNNNNKFIPTIIPFNIRFIIKSYTNLMNIYFKMNMLNYRCNYSVYNNLYKLDRMRLALWDYRYKMKRSIGIWIIVMCNKNIKSKRRID